jgi:hypothetical protein
MNSLSKVKSGNVVIEHHSTSSSIEITITTSEQVEQGKFKEKIEKVWIDYETFQNLTNATKLMNLNDLWQ